MAGLVRTCAGLKRAFDWTPRTNADGRPLCIRRPNRSAVRRSQNRSPDAGPVRRGDHSRRRQRRNRRALYLHGERARPRARQTPQPRRRRRADRPACPRQRCRRQRWRVSRDRQFSISRSAPRARYRGPYQRSRASQHGARRSRGRADRVGGGRDPASILPPSEHEQIWEIQATLDFPGTVYGTTRETSTQERMQRQTDWYAAHLHDRTGS